MRYLIYNRMTCTLRDVPDRATMIEAYNLRKDKLTGLDVSYVESPYYGACVISYKPPSSAEVIDIHTRIAEHIADTTHLT